MNQQTRDNKLPPFTPGLFCGIGVGPGMPGLIPVVAWEFLLNCDLILLPRAKSADRSVARNCLPPHQIPESKFREIEFAMESDRTRLAGYYLRLADELGGEVSAGKKVAYLTIGDPLTYSTYIYLLRAFRESFPGLPCRTYPGVTSYCALAAATGFAIGEGKERVLILPCPNDMHELRGLIDAHDIVILMKIGERLPAVLQLLDEMEIGEHCAFGAHVGMAHEVVSVGISGLREHLQPARLPAEKNLPGYLSTMLIRKKPVEPRQPAIAAETEPIARARTRKNAEPGTSHSERFSRTRP